MPTIFISVGTNINRKPNLQSGIQALKNQFDDILLSPVYKTNAVGFEGDFFYNMVVCATTELPVDEVVIRLQLIENQHGRKRKQSQFVSRTLDLDLLLYDDLVVDNAKLQLPRKDILNYAFVLKPLMDIVPMLRHPLNHKSYRSLWENFKDKTQTIRAIEFDWN